MSFQSSQTQTAAKLVTGANTAERVPITMRDVPRNTASQLRYRVAGPSSAARVATLALGQPSAFKQATIRSIAERSGTTTTIPFSPWATDIAYCASNSAGSSVPVVTIARGASPAIVRLISALPPT